MGKEDTLITQEVRRFSQEDWDLFYKSYNKKRQDKVPGFENMTNDDIYDSIYKDFLNARLVEFSAEKATMYVPLRHIKNIDIPKEAPKKEQSELQSIVQDINKKDAKDFVLSYIRDKFSDGSADFGYANYDGQTYPFYFDTFDRAYKLIGNKSINRIYLSIEEIKIVEKMMLKELG